jgi:hypothetical protein
MELDNSIQMSSEYLHNQHFDAVIVASGFESRCTYLAEKINVSKIPQRISLVVTDRKDSISRRNNNEKLDSLGFSLFKVASNDPSVIPAILDDVCANSPNKANILIDYSSMPKFCYSAIINYFNALEDKLENVNLWFSYSPSEYSYANNISGVPFGIKPPALLRIGELALVLGLGCGRGCAGELSQMLKTNITYAFYASPCVDERFAKDVVEKNAGILQQLKDDRIVKYSIFDLNSINASLTKLCVNLRVDHEVLLAPIGPKPFSLMCYILSTRYPDIKIWDLPGGNSEEEIDRKAHGDLLLYKIVFTSEEVDY